MLRLLLPGALFAIFPLLVPIHAFSSPEPAPPDEPATMQGVLRYKVRGLSAVQGGFLSGGIMGVAAGAGMSAAATNFLTLLLNAAPLKKGGKLAGNPGMAQIHDFLRTGKGFDFSGAPVNAGYDIELSFELVSDGKGTWTLKSGNARYAGSTEADVTLSGDGGNVHRFIDRYRGQSTANLTRENAEITLRTTGKGDQQEMHLDVSASFPSNAVGKTIWSAMGGLNVITREDKGDVATWTLQTLGQEYKETKPETPAYTGVTWGKSGPPDSVLRGRETWQDIMDSGVLVEWELWDECSARIETPEEYDELVFDESTTGRIINSVKADIQPSFWDTDLHWDFKPVNGSEIDPRPDRANGNDFDLTYTKLPPKNAAFGDWLLKAEFATDRAKKAGCRNPKPHPVKYFFTRDVDNNPGPAAWAPGKTGQGMTPNWFYYWAQTAAANGGGSRTYYDPSCKPGVGGYYPFKDYIVICDLAQPPKHQFFHPFVSYHTDGIDTFGTSTLHEWKHHEDYTGWWPHGYQPQLDTDGDLVPNAVETGVEGGLEVPAPLNKYVKYFDPDMEDTLGYDLRDIEYPAYMKMIEWKIGSADNEDWSCPGHQGSDQCL